MQKQQFRRILLVAISVSVAFPLSALGECTQRRVDCDTRLVKIFSAIGLELPSEVRVTEQELRDAMGSCKVCKATVKALFKMKDAVFKVIDGLPRLDGIFDSACNSHNRCYTYGDATYGYSRNHCDSEFYDRMTRKCRDNLYFLDILTLGGCEAAAGSLYGVVRQLGEDAYMSSEQGECCEFDVDVSKSRFSMMGGFELAYLPANTAQCKISPELEKVHAVPDNETSVYLLVAH